MLQKVALRLVLWSHKKIDEQNMVFFRSLH